MSKQSRRKILLPKTRGKASDDRMPLPEEVAHTWLVVGQSWRLARLAKWAIFRKKATRQPQRKLGYGMYPV